MRDPIVPINPLPADFEALVAKTRALILRSKSVNTLRGYRADFADWSFWAESHHATAFPAQPEWIAMYLADRSSTLRAATLARRLNAIAFYHRQAGILDSPTYAPLVRATFQGIRREIGTAQTFKQALLTPEIRQMVACCPDTLPGLRDKALILISYALMSRRSETAALTTADVSEVPEGIVVTIRRSKTDPEGAGRTVGIPFGADPTTCPVRALSIYMDKAVIRSGAIFRAIDQKQRVSPVGLHPDSVGFILKRCVARACRKGMRGVKVENVAGHSTRAGGITQAAKNGVQEYAIRSQSGHKPGSKSFNRYIRLGEMFTRNAARGLGL